MSVRPLPRAMAIASRAAQAARDQVTVLLAQDKDAPRRRAGFQTHLEHTGEKEFESVLECSFVSYRLPVIVVVLPAGLEVVRQVKALAC